MDEPGRGHGQPQRGRPPHHPVRHRGPEGRLAAAAGHRPGRAAMALTEPAGGSDLQAIRTRATADRAGYRLDGVKTWITNARAADVVAVLCKTDVEAVPPSRGISIL